MVAEDLGATNVEQQLIFQRVKHCEDLNVALVYVHIDVMEGD